MSRLPHQIRADKFDRSLFVLLGAAEAEGETLDRKERALWTEVRIHLRIARSRVRQMMHEDDRKGTEG